MDRTKASAAVLLTAVLVLVGCGEDSETTAPPEPEGPATLSSDVQPILNNSCAFNGCHGGSILEPPGKPMSLAAGDVISNTVNVASEQLPSMARVEPGDPDASYLVHKVEGTHLDVGGEGTRMPEGLPPLSSAEIALIREWISEGAENN